MIAKIKKISADSKKKGAKFEKKVSKKRSKVEKLPEVKEEPKEPPKKLKGISKRFNVEKPAKKQKIKAEIKNENATETSANSSADVKPVRKQKSFGVVQIKCLPHGFYEEQLRGFFSQFGAVHRVRVKRSLKTGKSTGVGFVEFRVPEVAEIAAETMNNYLLMKNILKTKYIAPDKVTPNIMKNRVKVKMVDGQEIVYSSTMARQQKAIQLYNTPPSVEALKKRQNKFQKKLEAKKRQLAEAGIDFDVDKVLKKSKVAPQMSPKLLPEESIEASVTKEDTPGQSEVAENSPVSKKSKKVKKIKEKQEKIDEPPKVEKVEKAKKIEKTQKVEKTVKNVTKGKKSSENLPKVAASKVPKKKEVPKKENKKVQNVLKVAQKKSKKLSKK
uniref:Putative mki67 fha domain-interacting nucleolar phosphoprotein n=1 Tax=Nyssomyia neivai TaxID=330878 RepID=A0A1L8DHL4_9DIPT